MKPSEVIKKCGWCQGQSVNGFGQVCIFGAVMNSGLTMLECGKLMDRVAESVGMCAVFWNDEPGRTQEEVVKLLESFGQ